MKHIEQVEHFLTAMEAVYPGDRGQQFEFLLETITLFSIRSQGCEELIAIAVQALQNVASVTRDYKEQQPS